MTFGFKFTKQHDSMDCGPACLRMIFHFHGLKISRQQIYDKTDLGSTGVSLLSLADSAEKFGFESTSIRCKIEKFKEFQLPVILLWNQFHYVVLYKSSRDKYFIADPAVGKIKLTKKDFLTQWVADKQSGEGIVMLLQPKNEDYKNKKYDYSADHERVGLKKLYGHIWTYKKYFGQIIIGLFISSSIQLLLPFMTQSIVDTGIRQKNISFINLIIIGQAILIIGRLLVEIVRNRLLLYVSTHINLKILSEFWVKLMRLPLSFFQIRSSGDIFQRIADQNRIEQFLTGGTINTLFSLINLIVFSVVLYIYNSTFFFIFFSSNVLYFLWIFLFVPIRRNLDYKRFALSSNENSTTMQIILGMQDIKLSNSEILKRKEWERIQASIFNINFKGLTLNQLQQSGAFIINEGKNILITLLVSRDVVNGGITLGVMLAIQFIIGQLNSPIEQLLGFFQQAQDAKISLSRLNEIHELKEEEPSDKKFSNFLPKQSDIRFENISFSYPGNSHITVLDDVTFTIPHGKITAIVGMSGSGKSTILKLLMQFYSNYSGKIKIGENSITDIRPSRWRDNCGCVMQDGFIFNTNIANNIAIDYTAIDHDRLRRSCQVANILEFIESLPLGFNTSIGGDAQGLSQGQKQRILIARAVYKDPAFLFFDEATNALDANNEHSIVKNLYTFFEKRTVLIIAHRLSTIQYANNIIVMHEGKVVEQGSHHNLIERKGKYFELFKNQFQTTGS